MPPNENKQKETVETPALETLDSGGMTLDVFNYNTVTQKHINTPFNSNVRLPEHSNTPLCPQSKKQNA